MDECLSRLSAASFVSILSVLYLSTVCGRNSPGEGVHSMNVEELKMRLRALLHQQTRAVFLILITTSCTCLLKYLNFYLRSQRNGNSYPELCWNRYYPGQNHYLINAMHGTAEKRCLFLHFIGNFDFEEHKNKRMFVEHALDDRIMNIINRP